MADVVQRADVRVVQARDRPGFAIKPFPALGIIGHTMRQDLDRDDAIQPRVARAIDLAHAAGAEGGLNFVWAEVRARLNGH